uniref:Tr-type G domain-containing protein n=1 Tax=Parastrongyloides trichosuri TaxID=131310 RepID=A0A0N4ZP90_PARTI
MCDNANRRESLIRTMDSLPPENEYGNVEYKARLINISDVRVKHLVTQMKWRLEEGKGEAIYEIGVEDDGSISGLNDYELEQSLNTMKIMASQLHAKLTIINEKEVNSGMERRRMIEILVEKEQYSDKLQEIRMAILGSADAGKSTLCGVLSQGELDDGHGGARVNIFRYLHEFKTGKTSSICLTALGFDENGEMLSTKDDDKLTHNCKKIITLIDLAGDKKYLKTTIYGISGYRPNICCIVISGKGPTVITKEHLGFVVALNIPFFIVVTKIDSVNEEHLVKVIKSINNLLGFVSSDKTPVHITNETNAQELARDLYRGKAIIPIISVSLVSGRNLKILKRFIASLENRKVIQKINDIDPLFHVEEAFKITGVGIVVCGSLYQGTLSEGDTICIGPSKDGSFSTAIIESIHRKKQPTRTIHGGETASLAIKIIKNGLITRSLIRKGMVLVGIHKNPRPCKRFSAKFFLLCHSTKYVCVGFQGTVYIGTVCQTVTIVDIKGDALRAGEWCIVTFEFYCSPEFITVGTPLIFREGKTKGMGEVIDICV